MKTNKSGSKTVAVEVEVSKPWEFPEVLETALKPYNTKKLLEAVWAHDGKAKGTVKTDPKRGDLKITGQANDAGGKAVHTVNLGSFAFVNNATIVSRFQRQCDSLRTHFKREGCPTKPLTNDIFNEEIRTWLDTTFKNGRKPTGKLDIATGKVTVDNGHKGRSNGGVKPTLPVPPVPA